jgi:hypothetical protein
MTLSIFRKYTYILLPLLYIASALVAGINGGILRLGAATQWFPESAAIHALLLIGGFLGSLITLERSFNTNSRWLAAWNALSVIFLYFHLPILAVIVNTITAAVLSLLLLKQFNKFGTLAQLWMATGSLLWFAGGLVYLLDGRIAAAVPWWIAFLLFTIVAERLDLSKFLPTPLLAKRMLNGLLSGYILSLLLPFHSLGLHLQGAFAVAIALWLFRYDMAKRLIRKQGQFRYIGIGLTTGYFWLLAFGFTLLFGSDFSGFYELFLHSFFVGFVFSMIWAHAPILLPALLGSRIHVYRPGLIFVWALFQLSLCGRLIAVLTTNTPLRLWLGTLNAVSILLMLASMLGPLLYQKLSAPATSVR